MGVQNKSIEKAFELEMLNEIFNDISELNQVLESEIKEINQRKRVVMNNSTNIIELFDHFEVPAAIILEDTAKKRGTQFSINNLKHQRKMLTRYFK